MAARKPSPITGEPRNCCAPQKPPLCKGRWPEGPEGLCAGSYILRGLQVPANDPSVSLTTASVPIPSVASRHLPLTMGVGPYCRGAMNCCAPQSLLFYSLLLILLVMSRMVSLRGFFASARAVSTFRTAWITVEWSRLNSLPVSGRLRLVIFRIRYMAI